MVGKNKVSVVSEPTLYMRSSSSDFTAVKTGIMSLRIRNTR